MRASMQQSTTQQQMGVVLAVSLMTTASAILLTWFLAGLPDTPDCPSDEPLPLTGCLKRP